ncbi:Arginyl-tRNA--protein transferase 1 [Cystobasidiomycetes sp. EMM_F5]
MELQQAGLESMSYMMGFYIHTCQKMRYKVDYAPSYLLDPQTYEWIPFKEVCQAILDDNPYAIFSQVTNTPTRPASRAKASNGNSKRLPPERADIGQSSAGSESESGSESEIDEADEPKALRRPPPPGFLDPENLPTPLISSIYGFDNGRIMPLPMVQDWRSGGETQRKLREGIAALGPPATETCLFV